MADRRSAIEMIGHLGPGVMRAMPLAPPLITIGVLLRSAGTLFTVSPDAPDPTEPSEPLVDIYGTPWGQVLSDEDSAALQSSGTPTITIPDGIPAVE